MKKFLTAVGTLVILSIPVQSFAWTYDGMSSLNPFTGFKNCNPCKTQCKCKRQKLTKCEKLKGVKVVKQNGVPCGCAAPIDLSSGCTNCKRAF